MMRLYLRLALVVVGLIAGVILFAFTFTAAAVVVVVTLLILALVGRPPQVQWHFEKRKFEHGQKPPLVIDHDPNDLPKQ
jgi:hypothetical protein